MSDALIRNTSQTDAGILGRQYSHARLMSECSPSRTPGAVVAFLASSCYNPYFDQRYWVVCKELPPSTVTWVQNGSCSLNEWCSTQHSSEQFPLTAWCISRHGLPLISLLSSLEYLTLRRVTSYPQEGRSNVISTEVFLTEQSDENQPYQADSISIAPRDMYNNTIGTQVSCSHCEKLTCLASVENLDNFDINVTVRNPTDIAILHASTITS